MLRRVAEHVSHRLVFRRRLPPPFAAASIYATTEGGLRYLARPSRRLDPELLTLTAELVQPGDVVWDIGANVGLFSFAAAAAAGSDGRVLALEPDTMMAGLLRRSAAANPALAPVEVLCAAAAGQVGVARFCVAARNRATSYLAGHGTAEAGGTRMEQVVPTVTLDWLAGQFPVPSVIKIDVEEAELEVLGQAAAVLSAGPKIICEVDGRNAAAVAELLAGHGYQVLDGGCPPARRVPLAQAPPATLALRAG